MFCLPKIEEIKQVKRTMYVATIVMFFGFHFG